MQCDDGDESTRGAPVGGAGCEGKAFLVLMSGSFFVGILQGAAWG